VRAHRSVGICMRSSSSYLIEFLARAQSSTFSLQRLSICQSDIVIIENAVHNIRKPLEVRKSSCRDRRLQKQQWTENRFPESIFLADKENSVLIPNECDLKAENQKTNTVSGVHLVNQPLHACSCIILPITHTHEYYFLLHFNFLPLDCLNLPLTTRSSVRNKYFSDRCLGLSFAGCGGVSETTVWFFRGNWLSVSRSPSSSSFESH
jgi:hypothetical protein